MSVFFILVYLTKTIFFNIFFEIKGKNKVTTQIEKIDKNIS